MQLLGHEVVASLKLLTFRDAVNVEELIPHLLEGVFLDHLLKVVGELILALSV